MPGTARVVGWRCHPPRHQPRQPPGRTFHRPRRLRGACPPRRVREPAPSDAGFGLRLGTAHVRTAGPPRLAGRVRGSRERRKGLTRPPTHRTGRHLGEPGIQARCGSLDPGLRRGDGQFIAGFMLAPRRSRYARGPSRHVREVAAVWNWRAARLTGKSECPHFRGACQHGGCRLGAMLPARRASHFLTAPRPLVPRKPR